MRELGSVSPLVSVIIPTYQRAHLIREAIDSVLAQTYHDFEIIVIDDGSNDGTSDVLADYGNRVRYIYQNNRGPSSARNLGIRAAQGELIAFQDSDDVWLPEKLAKQVPLFDRDPNIGLVYCDMTYFRSDGPSDRPSSFRSHAPPASGNALRALFVNGTPMHTPTAIVRRSCFNEVGFFDEDLRYFEDQAMWFRLAAMFKVDYVNAPLVACRVSGESSPTMDELFFAMEVRKRVLSNSPWLAESLSNEELRKGYYHRYAYRSAQAYLAMSETDLARKLLAECLEFNPLWIRARLAWLGSYFPRSYLWAQRLRGNDIASRFRDDTKSDTAFTLEMGRSRVIAE